MHWRLKIKKRNPTFLFKFFAYPKFCPESKKIKVKFTKFCFLCNKSFKKVVLDCMDNIPWPVLELRVDERYHSFEWSQSQHSVKRLCPSDFHGPLFKQPPLLHYVWHHYLTIWKRTLAENHSKAKPTLPEASVYVKYG